MKSANDMTFKLTGLARRYQIALRQYLRRAPLGLESAQQFGRRAVALGLETLDMARIHERILITLLDPSDSPGARVAMIRQAGKFFAEAITPIEQTHRTACEANVHLNQMVRSLHRRSTDLAESNPQLQREILQRKTVEESLRSSERHSNQLLEQSRELQEQLRQLSRQLLWAQEEERKKISRELHDEIAQTLTGINVRLAALMTETSVNTQGLQLKIAQTQRMVEKSVDIVHRFARDLRPTVLDDLGLIPALHSFVKAFSKQTHVHVRLTVSAGLDQLNNAHRTVLYRVVQEALTNVGRHAHASQVEVAIQRRPCLVSLMIHDNGKSFEVRRVLHAKSNQRLGLLGMRERIEMIGGQLVIDSAPGKGTTIRAEIPFAKRRKSRTPEPDSPTKFK